MNCEVGKYNYLCITNVKTNDLPNSSQNHSRAGITGFPQSHQHLS